MKKIFVVFLFPILVALIQIPTLGELLWSNESTIHFNYWGHFFISVGSFLILGSLLLLIYKWLGGFPINWFKWNWKLISTAGLAAVVSQLIQFLISVVAGIPTNDPATITALHSGISSITVLTLLVLSPILEEILFQGILQQGLLGNLRPFLSIGITALLFAIIHGYSFGIETLELIFSGLAYALAFWYTNDLKSPILAHGLSNLIVMVLLIV
ncbi:CPBP family intramembrane metalloprotease [Fructilactobacillus myrtifloralis]|uniref:CPBP family intramembrane metalloprotease n=1 Tax=Fructilactobacillus myrtifloralis TaxID=2940301 RepID=A0ABY5BQG7_9LACO|nr:type II CAAX endopeptidase family protein [Fructilactobacillus myrtifloralis]USS85714.1 CPBP family intramembrane metalloprotease [Fructilactobacillus myrtifloralis]